jgi:Ca-activated chloride channel family protein
VSFSDPRWLQALLALPVLALLEWLAARRSRRDLAALVGERPGHPLLEQVPAGGRGLGAALRLAAAASLVIGAAGPEWGREVVRRASTGSDVVILLDVSASMDARDVPPSRMVEARREAIAVVDRLGGCRIAMVAFAGEAVRLCPLTLDRSAVQLLLESTSTALVSEPGTDLGRGLAAALKALPGGRREEQAIVLWTDGEDLEQGARAAIDEVARSGIRVFAIGVGTAAGDVVPVLDGDGRMVDVKRDAEGAVVRSRLDEDLLRTLARRTHGAYFPASRPGGELPRVASALAGLARGGRETRLVERPMARFPLFAAVAALLLAGDLLRPKSRVAAAARRRAAPALARAALLALAFVALLAPPARSQSAWARGDRAFRAGRYAEAESLYARRLRGGAPADVEVNRATARALGGRTEEAERLLGGLAQGTDAAGRAAGYNLGTLLGSRGEYDRGLASLRRVLESDPADEDARWNYEVLWRRREEARRRSSQRQEARQQPQEPDAGGRGGGQAPQPPPSPSAGAQGGPPSQPPPSGQTAQSGQMSREQADRLLDALDEMARRSPMRGGNVRAVREKRGRDW